MKFAHNAAALPAKINILRAQALIYSSIKALYTFKPARAPCHVTTFRGFVLIYTA
jgi:hypothetical protein